MPCRRPAAPSPPAARRPADPDAPTVRAGGRRRAAPAAPRPARQGRLASSARRSRWRCRSPQVAGSWVDALETAGVPVAGVRRGAPRPSSRPAAPPPGSTDRAWLDAVLAACPDDAVRAVVHELAVDPLPIDEADARYAQSVIARLLEIDASRRITDLKARLQRIEPASDPDTYQALFADVLALESLPPRAARAGRRRRLRHEVPAAGRGARARARASGCSAWMPERRVVAASRPTPRWCCPRTRRTPPPATIRVPWDLVAARVVGARRVEVTAQARAGRTSGRAPRADRGRAGGAARGGARAGELEHRRAAPRRARRRARRAFRGPPRTRAPTDLRWSVVFDAGLDPSDPALRDQADDALADLRTSLGV